MLPWWGILLIVVLCLAVVVGAVLIALCSERRRRMADLQDRADRVVAMARTGTMISTANTMMERMPSMYGAADRDRGTTTTAIERSEPMTKECSRRGSSSSSSSSRHRATFELSVDMTSEREPIDNGRVFSSSSSSSDNDGEADDVVQCHVSGPSPSRTDPSGEDGTLKPDPSQPQLHMDTQRTSQSSIRDSGCPPPVPQDKNAATNASLKRFRFRSASDANSSSTSPQGNSGGEEGPDVAVPDPDSPNAAMHSSLTSGGSPSPVRTPVPPLTSLGPRLLPAKGTSVPAKSTTPEQPTLSGRAAPARSPAPPVACPKRRLSQLSPSAPSPGEGADGKRERSLDDVPPPPGDEGYSLGEQQCGQSEQSCHDTPPDSGRWRVPTDAVAEYLMRLHGEALPDLPEAYFNGRL